MRISVILAHPSCSSFNYAIAQTVVQALRDNGHEVFFHDLYREEFDPVLPAAEMKKGARLPACIKRHCGEIKKAQGLVLVHPNWWGEPPAILKGWVDRVLRAGVAYDFPPGPEGAAGLPIELLGHIRVALVLNTSDTPRARENKVLKDPLQRIWQNTLLYCGVRKFSRTMYCVIVTSTARQRKAWLRDAAKTTHRLFPPVSFRKH
jgi:putative NADPH-quinone reductase